MIINGDRQHLAFMLRKLNELYTQQNQDEFEDSLETEEFKRPKKELEQLEPLKESLTLSRSEEPAAIIPFAKKNSEQLAKL
jgi:hypothetical protein